MEITNATTTFEGTGLSEFFKAMAAAQAEMKPVYKDAKNDAFKGSKYATLAAVCEVVIPIMSKHGLAVLQAPGSANGEVTVETIIGHASGTMMRTSLALKPTKADPQGVGSAITYGRRYALLSLAGVAPEDDDGNAASASTAPARQQPARQEPPQQSKADSRALFSKLETAVRNAPTIDELNDLWAAFGDEVKANAFKADIINLFAARKGELAETMQEAA